MAILSPREQGDVGERSAAEWLLSKGYVVWVPFGHSPHVDLIAQGDDELLRVQVKTSTQHRGRRWEVMICTRGGNRSWDGVAKLFSPTRCDWLFVLVGDGRRWFIPAQAVGGSTGLKLGGPKYSEFEVDRGRPLPSHEPT